jgi:hypothetical protein
MIFKTINNESFRKLEYRYDSNNRLIQKNVDNVTDIYEYQNDTDDKIKTHTSTIESLQKIVKTNDGIKLTKENKIKDIYLYSSFNDKLITVKYTIEHFNNFNNYYIKSIKITNKNSKLLYESIETCIDNPAIVNEILALDK